MRPFGHNRHGPKSGGAAVPLSVGKMGPPSNTMWPGPAPRPYLHTKWHLNPSNCLTTIHQRHRQTDRTGQDRQRCHSIGEPFYKRSPKNRSAVGIVMEQRDTGSGTFFRTWCIKCPATYGRLIRNRRCVRASALDAHIHLSCFLPRRVNTDYSLNYKQQLFMRNFSSCFYIRGSDSAFQRCRSA